MIIGAVPVGSMRAPGQVAFLAAVRCSPPLAHVRADRWDSLWRVAQSVALRTDWQLGTARPTWAVLMGDTGLSRRTVARRLVDLQQAGLLGVVATGRSAGTDPAEPDAGNQAGVYVLAIPHALRPLTGGRRSDGPSSQQHQAPATPADQDEHQAGGPGRPSPAVTRPDEPVDQSGTPSLSGSLRAEDKPTHARKTKINHERASSPSPISGLSRAELIAAGPLCSGSERAPGTKNGRLLAAAELRRRDPVLGRASTPDVASMLRVWFLAGWTINDIHHAINRRPDGTLWPHQLTVADVADVRGWTRYRLRAWLADPLDPTSPPGRSHSARAEADQAQARDRAQDRAEADALTRAATAGCPCAACVPNPAAPTSRAATDMAAARARLRHNQLTRAHRHP